MCVLLSMRSAACVFSLTIVLSAVRAHGQSCYWTNCANKIISVGHISCSSGYSYNNQGRDCGQPTCIWTPFGQHCSYFNEQHMCCPGNCNWWDVNCNWATLQAYFTSTSNHIKTAWSQLSHHVQDKLTTGAKFQTLLDSELLSLDFELLSELKAVFNMTLHQFKVIATKVNDMASTHLQHFLDNVAPDALSDGIDTLGHLTRTWTSAQVTLIKDKLSSSTMWGAISNWTSSKVSALGTMLANFDTNSLRSMADTALAHAANLVQLGSAQLGPLANKFLNMSQNLLTTMLPKLNKQSLIDAMSAITGVDLNWAAGQVQSFMDNLMNSTAWGQLSSWTSTNVEALGNMLSQINISQLLSFADSALAAAANVAKLTAPQIGQLGAKLFHMTTPLLTKMLNGLGSKIGVNMSAITSIDYDWTVQQVHTFVNKLKDPNTWGAAASWTYDKINSLGNMLANVDITTLLSFDDWSLANAANLIRLGVSKIRQLGAKMWNMNVSHLIVMLQSINRTALAESMLAIAGVAGTWLANQTSAFVAALQSPDAWGAVYDWTSSKISSLGSMINSLDLQTILRLDQWSFANAANLVKLTVAQLSRLGQRLFSMNATNLATLLTGLNVSTLMDSLTSLTGIDFAWAYDQATAFVTQIRQSAVWGNITQWTSSQLSKLGSVLSNLPPPVLALLDDFSLSNAANLAKFGVTQLGNLAAKVFGLNVTNLRNLLDGLNATVLCNGLHNLAQTYLWTSGQASVFQSKLLSPSTCGSALTWTATQISSLGTMLTRLNVSTIVQFADSALAHAKSLATLSANKLTALSQKLGDMQTSHFQTALNNLNATSILSSMTSQCNIQCQNDADMTFLNDPSMATAQSAVDSYAQTVMQKSNGAALAYAQGFCNAGGLGATNYTNISRSLFARLQAAAIPCTGSVAVNNTVSTTFARWSNSKAGLLIGRLTGGNAFGPLSSWSNTQMSAMCNQYAALTPSTIAGMTASSIISTSASVAMMGALVAAFGPLAPVASYAIAKTGDQITPQQRAAWAAKFKTGLGNVAGWGCAQVASLQTMASGLAAADLSAIPVSALKGLAPNAITAMNAGQVQGFSPTQLISMDDDVRKRVHGNLLGGLSSNQKIAAVCGSLTAGSASCPAAAVDVSLQFPSGATPSQSAIAQHFVDNVPNVAASQVQVLYMVPTSALPNTGSSTSGSGGRRLAAASTEVAVRVGVSQHSQTASATAATNSAASSLAAAGSGSVVQTAIAYDVTVNAVSTTTTATNNTSGPNGNSGNPNITTTTTTTATAGLSIGSVTSGAPTFPPILVALLALMGTHVLSM